MKKVLAGELTSLAHSILKSNGDNVHELKEKAGLLYEKLCVLSFAEKHFAGKQPNIGKAAFKSAFEMDLDEIITPNKTTDKPDKESLQAEIPVAKENVSTENVTLEEIISEKEKPTQLEAAEKKEETSTSTEAISTEKEDSKEETQQAENTTPTEAAKTNEKTSTEEETPSTEKIEGLQPNILGLTEEDFGVHFDELPDFEPAPAKSSIQKPSEETAQPHKEEAKTTEGSAEQTKEKTSKKPEVFSTEKVNKPAVETPKLQRTMDLFSQDKKSLNDQLKTELKVGLNDRLAFTKKLFEGNIEAYNRVMAKMSEFSNFQEAKTYLTTQVKPNYAWEEHEAVEQRFLEILEAKLG